LASQSWQLVPSPSSPAVRSGHRMCFDSARSNVLLFGGYDWGSNTNFDDTWTFDGASWSSVATPVKPPSRQQHGLCFDRARGVAVLFGGYRGGCGSSYQYRGDAWEFDGAGWQQVALAGASPSARQAPMAYDTARQVSVLFGGTSDSAPYVLADTWEYDGVAW